MFKKLQLICLGLLGSLFLTAQDNQSKDYLSKQSGTEVPSQEWNDWFNGEVEKFKKAAGKTAAVNHTIPVIVHVIHFGETLGTYPNIDSNQIKSQFVILNNDYAGTGLNYTNVPQPFANLISNTGVQFCRATKDPNGVALQERGIHRINAATQGWQNPNTPTLNIVNYINTVVKPSVNAVWDPLKYLNIWISDKPATVTINGFATWPAGTTNAGIPTPGGTNQDDGVWIWTKKIGDVGTIVPGNKGRTATREIGHWLGLRNIWGDGNCLTDYCGDTPWSKSPNTGCPIQPANVDRCGPNLSPNGEMTMNFMDDTDEGCKYMFTPDQTTRIQTTMSQCTYRNQLGTHNLCVAPILPPTAPNPLFSVVGVPCVGTPFTPNNSTTGWPTPTYQWNSAPAANFYPNDLVPNPAITFGGPGTYTLYLTATNTVNIATYSLVVSSVTTCPVQPLCLDTLEMIKNIDTLTTYSAPSSTLNLNCQGANRGYLTGTNCYQDKEFAQFFPASTYSNIPYPQVNSVIVLFDSKGTKSSAASPGTQIACKIYGGAVGTGPSNQMAIRTDSLKKIAATTKTNTIKYCGTPNYTFSTSRIIPFKFDFTPLVSITPNSPGFFVAVETPFTSPLDSINIFSNTKTNLTNDSSSWVLLNVINNWRTLRYLKSSKIQLAMLPQVTCRTLLGVEENTSVFASNITVMPNPNNGMFHLLFTLPKEDNLTVKIMNALGQQISSDDLENVSNNMIDINMEGRPDGIYFIEVSNKTEKVVRKIIISR